MKLMISSIDVTLVCTILVSTLCLALCSDSESMRPPDPPALSGQDRTFWPTLNDRILKDYYNEMYKDADPIWKRAPSSGFYGMRGKKVPASNFYGMRGKKGPSGFLGMRGKKDGSGKFALNGDSETLDNLLGDLWASKESQQGLDLQDKLYNYHLDENKRAPADGFMGLRGKRNASPRRFYSQTSH